MKFRIAVAQISSESNHFVRSHCELDLFRNTGYLLEGDKLLDLRGSGTEVGGILATLEEAGDVEIAPVLAARANSSGPLSKSCYEYLRSALLTRLKDSAPVDGVVLSHHGSMAAVGEDDPEGDIVGRVRKMVGASVPIVVTVDLHSNVTTRMVETVNAIVSYKHYPHDDVFATGVRGASLLLKTLRREVRPVTAQAKLPMILTAFNSSTLWDTPFAQLVNEASRIEKNPGILSVSVLLVGSYLDIPGMGCSVVVVADNDEELAKREASHLADAFWARRHEFQVKTYSVVEAVDHGRKIEGGPVLLLDTADTTGGGASGDGVGVIKALLEMGGNDSSIASVVDPEAAKACFDAGKGSEITLRLGHKLDPTWGQPITVTGRVLRLADEPFQYTGGIFGGTCASMGPSAVLQSGNLQILIASYPTYEWADEQYRCMGMDPVKAKFVGVKNMMNFRFAYRDVMKGFFVLDLPGPTPPDMRMLDFVHATRPLFPLDDISSPEICVSFSSIPADR